MLETNRHKRNNIQTATIHMGFLLMNLLVVLLYRIICIRNNYINRVRVYLMLLAQPCSYNLNDYCVMPTVTRSPGGYTGTDIRHWLSQRAACSRTDTVSIATQSSTPDNVAHPVSPNPSHCLQVPFTPENLLVTVGSHRPVVTRSVTKMTRLTADSPTITWRETAAAAARRQMAIFFPFSFSYFWGKP